LKLRESSRASAQSVPARPAFIKVMLTLAATATVPCELDAAANAKSARVKIAPPCTVP